MPSPAMSDFFSLRAASRLIMGCIASSHRSLDTCTALLDLCLTSRAPQLRTVGWGMGTSTRRVVTSLCSVCCVDACERCCDGVCVVFVPNRKFCVLLWFDITVGR